MWKIICVFLLFERALSAPQGCAEICNSLNSQSHQRMSCCSSPMVSSSPDDKNWTDHRDFQTNDGALVHTKDGRFAHGNTRGSFNEMSYYKEFHSGDNQNFEANFATPQRPGGDLGINQKLEDLSTSSHSSFETMFQSQFAGAIKNYHDAIRHLQELKRKDQLPVQDCVYPCVPINDQITRLQQNVATQQQYVQRLREDFWARMQNHNTITEAEPVSPLQQPTQSTYYPGQVVKEINRHESYHNEKITTHPHVNTKVNNQPIKYSSPQQPSEAGSSIHQDYASGSASQYGSVQFKTYGSGAHSQTGYDSQTRPSQIQSDHNQQTSQYGQNYGSGVQTSQFQNGHNQQTSSQYGQNYGSGIQSSQIQSGHNQQTSSQYGQNHGSGIQSQAGYTQDNSGYGSQIQGSPTKGGHNRQGAVYGSQSYQAQSYYNSGTQGGHGQQNSAYGTQYSGSQTDGSHTQGGYGQHNSGYRGRNYERQTDATQDCGPNGCAPQGSVTITHDSTSRSSVTHNYGVGFGSTDGKLTHGLIQVGSGPDCNDESQPQPYRRYKRNTLYPHYRHHKHHSNPQHSSESTSQQVEDFGEPTKVQKVSQQEIQDLGQQVEDIKRGKLETQDKHQQNQHHEFDDYYQSGNLEFGKQHGTHSRDFSHQQSQDFGDFSQQSEGFKFGDDNQQRPLEVNSLSQQTEGFDASLKSEDQHLQKSSDFSHRPRGFNQKTVGPLSLDQHARDSLNFNQFQTPVLAPDSYQAGNQRYDGVNQQFKLPTKPAPKPTSRPRNSKLNQLNLDKNSDAERIFNPDQGIQSPFENIRNTGRGDISAENEQTPTDQALTPPEAPDTQVGYQQSSEEIFKKGFGQQVLKSGADFSQQQQKPFRDFSYQVQGEDFSQHDQKYFEDFSQQVQNPSEDFYQQVLKPGKESFQKIETSFERVSQQSRKPGEGFSQHIQKPFEDFSQQAQNPSDDFSQQVLKPGRESFQKIDTSLEILSQKPDETFSQHTQKPSRESFQKFEKPLVNLPQQVQNPNEKLSQDEQKPFNDFSQQALKPNEEKKFKNLFEVLTQHVQKPDGFPQIQKPYNDFSQEVQKPSDEFFQQTQDPYENFSQQVLKPSRESFQKIETSFDGLSQQVQKPGEDLSQHEEFSQQVLKPSRESFQKFEKPSENLSQQVQEPGKDFSHIQRIFKKFPQEVQNPSDEVFQQVQNPSDEFSQQAQNPSEDFSQIVLKPGRESYQNVETSFDILSQQVQKSGKELSHTEKPLNVPSQQIQESQGDSFQKIQKPVTNFSKQVEVSRENLSDIQKPFDDFSRQIQTPLEDFPQIDLRTVEDSSQKVQTPNQVFPPVQKQFKPFSQQNNITPENKVQKPLENSFQEIQNSNKDLSQQIQKSLEDISQHVQRLHKDLSQTSDLRRNKDVTQLPQSFQDQNEMIDHSNSNIFQQSQEFSLGHQWHHSHNPSDLTNEDLYLGRLSDPIQQTQKVDESQQLMGVQKQTPNKEEEELKFDQQTAQKQLESWQKEMNREAEIIYDRFGKLEFGQSVQNQRNDPQINSEITLLSLQPRILQAYGGKGPYDPMHSEEIFSDVRENPSATLPPVMFDDPWDIREKPVGPFDMVNEDAVIPLDTVWVYPEEYPVIPVTETPNPGFWNKVGRRFTNAVDKAKEKARDIFG